MPIARSGILMKPAEGTKSQSYGCIETAFARRNYPSCNNKKGGFHNGLDIAAKYGTPLHSAEDGRVIAVGNAPYAYGVWAVIEHENGLVTAYTHMSIRSVKIGQEVKRGDVIGYLGKTGYATGPHLHFTVFATQTIPQGTSPEGTKPSRSCGPMPVGGDISPLRYLDSSRVSAAR